jgi:hypothetical protein
MERTSINSSDLLSSVGYDPGNQTLEIEFGSGEVHQYHDVPFAIYNGLMDTPSHEEYFRASIENTYSGIKVA